MKIRKFFAGSSREALRQVREALGPDAVVLSNRAVDGGVELVALAENDLANLAGPDDSVDAYHDDGYAPPRQSPAPSLPPSRPQALPDPFAATFGASAASIEQASQADVGAPPRSRPVWDEGYTSGYAADYAAASDGRTAGAESQSRGTLPAAPAPARRGPEPTRAVEHVVERAVERSLRQRSEQLAGWRTEASGATDPASERGDGRADARMDPRTEARARNAQFAQHQPEPQDRIIKSSSPALTPATAMARKMGAPAAPTHPQPDVAGSAAFVAPASTAISAPQPVASGLPESAAALAVPPARPQPAPEIATPAPIAPQQAYSMRTTVTATLGSRFPGAGTATPVAQAAMPALNLPLASVLTAGEMPPEAAPQPALEPVAAAPAEIDAQETAPAAAVNDLAEQIAAEPASEAQAHVAEMVAQSVIDEIHSMRGVIEEQLAGLMWSDRQRREPARGQAAKTLLAAGFSAQLVKLLIERMPNQIDYAHAMDWLKAALARNLPVLQNEDALLERGGVYALMGPTGVGKTTTTAKLAARCVMRYGANRVALLTTDSYRIGAHEQLRIYGKILGVGVHAVKDAADLRLALSELRNKHMVLIDTIGMSQRDRTVSEQVAMLCGTGMPVQRLLLLNATSHGDTLNEVVQAYRNRQATEGYADLAGCILTKLDEATNIGAVLDTVIRYRLPVHYVSTGQKVPENLYVARKDFLMESAFCVPRENSPFVPADDELAAIMASVPTHKPTDLSEVRLG